MTDMIDIQKLTELLASRGVASASELLGVAARDIRVLENQFGITLPESYRLFLSHMGRSAGHLSPWMAIYFDDLKEIKEQFALLNATLNSPVVLPANALLIAHWESIFDYIVCDGNDDPEVFRVDLCPEGTPTSRSYAPSYSQYLNNLALTANIYEIPADLLEDLPVQHFAEDTINY
jgi:SMI1 / KNR4 family (SUKH-1)